MRLPGPTLAAALTALATLFGACVAQEPSAPPDTPGTPASAPSPTAWPAPSPIASGPLTAADVARLLRSAICWYDDPSLAASCLPPSSETVEAIESMGRSGDPRFVAPLVDMRWLDAGWERWVEDALEAITGERFDDPRRWYEWQAAGQPRLPDGYLPWKGHLLSLIDPSYAGLLSGDPAAGLRPDLLLWGGTAVDEVAPLRDPVFVHRLEERYLLADDVVFGLVLDGRARAYPRRIVGWHQLIEDEIGDETAAIVFCPPCGGAVAYDPRVDGERYDLGISGLIYESRSLLFDSQSNSLWDAFTGRPVLGTLLNREIELQQRTLVTTTWADWAARHPNTSVLALDTGHVRDYSAGAALRGDPQAPAPAFPVRELDGRLPAKEPVLGLLVEGEARAYSVEHVRAAGIVHDTVGELAVVLLSEGAGAAIGVYRAGGLKVSELTLSSGDLIVIGDDGGDGTRWFMEEEALVSTVDGRRYAAVSRREGYWFTGSGVHPETTIWGE